MASIKSVAAYDNSAFSLAEIFRAATDSNLSHSDLQVGATTYVDVLNIAVANSIFPYHFGGSGFVFDAANDRITAGTVNAIVGTSGRFSDPIANQTVAFSITGLKITASAIAAARADATKDAALTEAVFRGNDRFSLSVDDDIAYGHGGNDTMLGRGGRDELYGDAGNDTLDGGAGNDWLTGGAGDDTIIGGSGIDRARYSDATVGVIVSLLQTGAQNTGQGMDVLSSIEDLGGSPFGDRLIGDAGANRLYGFLGNDRLSGGAGEDRLYGGSGNDQLTGGTGKDYFIFEDNGFDPYAGAVTQDTITDFRHAQGDLIALKFGRFNGLAQGAVDPGAFLAADGAQTAQDTDDRLIYDTATGKLYYDADGAGGVAAVHFATIGTASHPVLTASDFIVYNILI
ncbi:calcium-binding protein [Novosphingobium sp. PASSN1]|uniref:calcium-binding protein n=1 Tax=Novosphingobium sp. PASSN1 TaxID=2015561 RepID=UPI0025E5DCCF|nr:calcium-binding protein [Novosphingobium sp. PASSN1]